MAIVLNCKCGKHFSVDDKLGGKRIRCPACAQVLSVPRPAVVLEDPPNRQAVRGGAPPVVARPPKAPLPVAEALATAATAPASRYLWVSIGASVPLVILGVVLTLYFLLSKNPDGALVAENGDENQPVKVKVQASVRAQGKSAVPAKSDAQSALPQRVHEILKANCYRCHGQDGENEGGLNYVVDLATLVSRNKVVPGKPDESPVYQRITAGRRPMPPKGEDPRPTEPDIAALRKWIEEGAQALDSGEADRDFITDAALLKFIHDDLQKLDERSRRFTRYFTITHLYNAGRSEDELQTFRLALSKLVNSLSWERDIEVPRPIDPGKTILRVDLRHYQWTPAVWNRILTEYPYAVKQPGPTAAAAYAAADSDMPYARADWFVFAASRPPLYHDVLELPQNDRELEKRLNLDAGANIRNEKVARAGFNSSGVSSNNRMIERHRSGYGAYWKSYDFASNQDRKNLFAFPLGPSNDGNSFQHDGGEIIFSLPNGLQGYFLTDSRGARIDKGPTSIVRDDRQADRSVVNGVSCMSCHAQGMIEKFDQVREHVERNAGGFAADVAATIRALYPPRDKFAALLKEDAERFAAAVKKTGAHLSTTEPIAVLALRYTNELDLTMAAAEAGLDVEAFRKMLKGAPQLARTLGPLNAPGGTVQRDVYVSTFPELARTLLLAKSSAATQTPAPGVSQPNVPMPAVPAVAVPADVFALIENAVKENRVQLEEKGFKLGTQFRDVPADGALLIGFNASHNKGPFGIQVAGVQPIYMTRGGEKTGPWYGLAAQKPAVIKAKPGYVVGGLQIRSGTVLDAFAVTFVRLERDKVVPTDTYDSDFFGGKTGNPSTVGAPGALVVGICGHVGRRGGEVCALGTVSVGGEEVNRRLLKLGLVALLGAGLFVAWLWWTTPTSGVNWATANRIQVGMSQDEVQAIIGTYPTKYRMGCGPFGTEVTLEWCAKGNERETIRVMFDGNRRVSDKTYNSEFMTILDKLRGGLHLD